MSRITDPLLAAILATLATACSGQDQAQGDAERDTLEADAGDIADGDESDTVTDAAADSHAEIDGDADAQAGLDLVEDTNPPRELDSHDVDVAPEDRAHCMGFGWSAAVPAIAVTRYSGGLSCDGYRAALHDTGASLRVALIPDSQEAFANSWVTSDPTDPASTRWGTADDGRAVLCADDWAAFVSADSCAIEVVDARSNAIHTFDGEVTVVDGGVETGFELPVDESWFGCGENTGPLDRRGTTSTYWNTDAYDGEYGGYAPGASPLYLSLPFCMAIRGGVAHGVFVDHTWRMAFDIGHSDAERFEVRAEGPTLVWHVVPGPTPADVNRRYRSLTGAAHLPPRWAFGFHQSRWGYGDSRTFRDLAAEFRARRLPADTLWFDIQHMDGFRTFTWNRTAFGNPADLLAELGEAGFHTVAIADPGIKVDEAWALYRDARDRGVFLENPDGSAFVGTAWPGAASFPDFTLPAAVAWWAEQVAATAAFGVDGIWLDVNEPTTFPEGGGGNTVPNETPVWARGELGVTMAEVHNLYGSLEAAATFAGLLDARPDERPFILSRSGFSGLQRWAGVWTGDAPSSWHALGETLAMMVNVGVSGVPIVGSDVGGYSGGATPELYARWFELGFVSPFFRAHVTNSVPGQEPWMFGTEVTDIARYWLERRSALMPYLYSVAWDSSRTGAPILRPLRWEFPAFEASGAASEAMFGPFMLVAPVLTAGATERLIELPPGRWYDWRSDAAWEGTVSVLRTVTLADLPIFVREGAIIPNRAPRQYEAQSTTDRLFVDVWPSTTASTFAMLDDDGVTRLELGRFAVTEFAAQADADSATISATRTGDYAVDYAQVEVRVARVDQPPSAVELDGVALAEVATLDALRGAPGGWWYDESARAVRVSFAAADEWSLRLAYDPALVELRPALTVPFEVSVPDGTPPGATVFVAGSFNEWAQQELGVVGADGIARGEVTVPRGEWYFFKFTRGGWETVEKYPACEEAENRYAFGEPGLRRDTVWQWRDLCE